MTDGAGLWLGIMAVALTVMTVVQVIVAMTAARYARLAARTLDDLRRDVRPLIEKANRLSEDAAWAAKLALTQAERLDDLMSSTARRVDETLGVVQGVIIEPVRQGAAAVAALRAALSVLRGRSDRGRHARDEEEALFVG